MSKTETLRQSAAASNVARLAQLTDQVETLRQTQHRSVEELAAALEPIAQAMAALTDETRATLSAIEARTWQQGEAFTEQLRTSRQGLQDATDQAQVAAGRLQEASSQLEWRHYALAMLIGVSSAALTTACWLWVAPPAVQNPLDAKAVAEQLKPAVIEALKPSKGR